MQHAYAARHYSTSTSVSTCHAGRDLQPAVTVACQVSTVTSVTYCFPEFLDAMSVSNGGACPTTPVSYFLILTVKCSVIVGRAFDWHQSISDCLQAKPVVETLCSTAIFLDYSLLRNIFFVLLTQRCLYTAQQLMAIAEVICLLC